MDNESERFTRPMIPVTGIMDRTESLIGNLGRDGQVALPRAVRLVVLLGTVGGVIAGFVAGVFLPGPLLFWAMVGGAAGYVLLGWKPDDLHENVPQWLKTRLAARKNKVELPCLGAGTTPVFIAPRGGRCEACDLDQTLNDEGLIESCGLKARVHVGCATLKTVEAKPVTVHTGVVRVADSAPTESVLDRFSSRKVN